MAISLKKMTAIEYTPVHLIDEEIISERDNRNDPAADEIHDYPETPESKRERFAEKISDIWFDITEFFSDGFGRVIIMVIGGAVGLALITTICLVALTFLDASMSKQLFDATAIETSAKIVSVGSAENKDVQGIAVIYTDVYGNEQKAKVLISKNTDMKVGDVISIRYDPSDTEQIEIPDNTIDTALLDS